MMPLTRAATASPDEPPRNSTVNSSLYRDNSFWSPPANPINIESDGLSVEMICSAAVNAGQTNHMKLAIADTSDQILDSVVMLKATSLSVTKPEACNDGVDNDDDSDDSDGERAPTVVVGLACTAGLEADIGLGQFGVPVVLLDRNRRQGGQVRKGDVGEDRRGGQGLKCALAHECNKHNI